MYSRKSGKDYKHFNPNTPLIVHPDDVRGLTAKIKWVYDLYPNVVMLDDDLNKFNRNFVDDTFELGQHVDDPDLVYEIIQHTGWIAEQMKVKLFGFAANAVPVTYQSHNPYKLSGFVIGGIFGLLEGFRLDIMPEDSTAACDYFISGISAYFERKCLLNNRYAVTSKEGTFKSKGGTADYRTPDTEKKDLQLLKEYFGDAIVRKKPSRVRKELYEWEKTLKIPF